MHFTSKRSQLIAISLVIVVILIFGELLLRILGMQAHQPIITTVNSNPANALVPNNRYGLALNPGAYEIKLNEGLTFEANHLHDSSRLSTFDLSLEDKKIISFYGCSFTYGMGVNDLETFPALVQQAIPNVHVRNFAAPGYGSIHSLLQLKNHLQHDNISELVIFGYSSFQDARNLLTGIQQKYWNETLSAAVHPDMHEARFPYAREAKDDLLVRYKPVQEFSKRWKLSSYSVLIYRFENLISNIIYGFNDKQKLSHRIINEMNKHCSKHKIHFVVVGLDRSASTDSMKSFCGNSEINYIDAALNIFDPAMNLQPFDSHPNDSAHFFYAEKITKYLEHYFSKQSPISNK